ncbi:hypothetical protein PENANT_c007G10634 [Penicillium antarcticum]|uniref:Uncharacterized protein n=1 Tax=Penicillium antarcticum TaxID=416450 RepID=A0A1V6QB93_9EURO|nr:hypothetical protein PENANT_c007G10634 [Penicillium antarcticum]
MTSIGNSPEALAPPKHQALYSSESSPNIAASDSPSHYSSFSSSDSDDPVPLSVADADEDAAGDVVGVSIGRQQSRMKARATPLEEKNRMLEKQGEYFATIPDTVGEDGLFASQITAEPEPVEPVSEPDVQRKERTSPSLQAQPQRRVQHGPRSDLFAPGAGKPLATAEHKDTAVSHRTSFVGNLLKTSLPRRPRAWSGELKKFLPDLASLRKRPSLSFRGSGNGQNRSRSQTVAPAAKKNLEQKRTSSLDRRSPSSRRGPRGPNGFSNDDDGEANQALSELRSPDGTSAAKHSFARRPSTAMPGRPPSLRRSSSDQSLYLRASSTASSLEQRPLYENVHSQVNSRFKAIKDSFQDSSSKLLSMPTLHDIRSDWGSRQFLPELGNGSHSTFNSNDNKETSQRTASPPPPRNNTNPTHPILEEAMAELTGDVVILGGYRGSILRSAKPPQRQLWVPMKVGLNLRKVDLEVGLNPEDEERMEETIIPSGVLSHVGPVDVCRRLMKRLRKSDNAQHGDLRVHDYGYDWRLSPELLSRRLIAFLEGLPCNQPQPEGSEAPRGATVIAHSLGGLITRHAVNERPDLFAGVVYAGVPQHCVNILGPLRNGDDVLLSSRVLTAQVNFTFRTSFALLPEDGHCFIDKQSKEEFRVDFFDANTWDEHRLSPCIAPALPTNGSLTNRGLKDLPIIGKRFSMPPRDDSDESLVQEASNLSDTHQQPVSTTDKDITARNPPHPSAYHAPIHSNTTPTPSSVAAYASEKAHGATHFPADGLVGPVQHPRGSSATTKAATTSTIPRGAAIEYLQRTLFETKRFKSNLAFRPTHHSENKYPPVAVLYGKTVPTVYGARVVSREGIKHIDAYDDLAFAAGDGVCLASAAMLPPGYRIIKDGLVKSDRGHVGLLGDLEGVGQCLRAINRGRKEGVGLGEKEL